MSARRHFGVRRLAAAFTVDTMPPYIRLAGTHAIAKAGASSRTPKSSRTQELLGFARNSEPMEIRPITAGPDSRGAPITMMTAAQRIALATITATSCPRRTTNSVCATGEPLSGGLPRQPSSLVRRRRRVYYGKNGIAQRTQRTQSSQRRKIRPIEQVAASATRGALLCPFCGVSPYNLH